MKLLLDTHTFLWFLNGDAMLSEKARRLIEIAEYEKYISIATFWEIAIKHSLGKLQLDVPFDELKKESIKNGFRILPITFEDTARLNMLPFHHRDPFDRIILSQAIEKELTLVSRDTVFSLYNQSLVW